MLNFDFLANYPFLQIIILNNTVLAWLSAAIIFLAVIGLLKIIKTVVIAKLKAVADKTKTDIDDIVISAIQAIHWPFYLYMAFYAAVQLLNVSPKINKVVFYIFLIALIYYAIRAGQQFVDFTINKIIKKRQAADQSNIEVIKLLGVMVKISLWVVALILLLSNLGYNVTSLIAGLGIGGVAVALALQSILGDLFSSLVIYFDKPFKIGDFIIVGDQMGTVKKVGLKTTRIQALQGEEIVIANNELTNARVQNFGVMKRRRIAFNVGVTYDTPHDKLKNIPAIIKKAIASQKNTTVDRIHFKAFGDSSLNYEVVYFVESGDYKQYMDIQQAINLAIVEEFEKASVEIAFPTRTVYLKK